MNGLQAMSDDALEDEILTAASVAKPYLSR